MDGVLAYVLISLGAVDEQEILQKLKEMEEVREAHVLFGEWDLIAKVEVGSSEELGEFMIEKIRKLPHVRLTSTLIAAK
ncbi:Lrp/AsnC family transcriptional regulator [Candidatus Woesearchaeota archaeon]|nr:MAG: Lrp/AsnC family transcriptional regulator [Candidatus Woesearchaeota archaeon]